MMRTPIEQIKIRVENYLGFLRAERDDSLLAPAIIIVPMFFPILSNLQMLVGSKIL